LINDGPHFNNFLLISINLLNLFFYVNFRNLFKLIFFLNCIFLFNLIDNLHFLSNQLFFYNFFYNIGNRFNMYSFSIDINRHSFLKSNRYWHFNRFNNNFIDLMHNMFFNWNTNNFIHIKSNRYFFFMYSYSLFNYFFNLDVCSHLSVCYHDGISRDLYLSVNCYVHYLFALDLDRYLDSAGSLNEMLDGRRHDWDFNYFLYYFLNDLWYFYYFLNYSRNYYYFLNNPFDFYALGHFNNFLYNFFFGSGYLFNSFEVHFHWYNSFFLAHNWNFFSHNVWDISGDLNWFFLNEDNMLDDLNRNVFFVHNCLNKGNLMNFSFYFNLRHNQRHLNIFFYFSNLYFLLNHYPWHFHLYNFNLFHYFQHFFYYLYLSRRSFYYFLHCHYFLNYLWDSYNSFLVLDDWDYLLDYFSYDLYSCFDMRYDLWYFLIFNDLNYLLYDLRNSNYPLFLYNFLHYFLNNDFHFLWYFFLSFYISHNLLDDLYLLQLFLNDNLLTININWFFNLNNLFNKHFFRF